MNKSTLQQLNHHEHELALIKSDLREISLNIPELNIIIIKLTNLSNRFDRHEKDFYTWVNTLTEELRNGEKLK
jgi:hypothetical protein